MAVARFPRSDMHDLPRLCARCGVPATTTNAKKYTHPFFWGGVIFLLCPLLFVIVVLIRAGRGREAKLQIPVCEYHRKRSTWPFRAFLVGALIAAGLIVGVFVLPGGNRDMEMNLVFAVIGTVFVTLLVMLGLIDDRIRALSVDWHMIELDGVDDLFANAVNDNHRRGDFERRRAVPVMRGDSSRPATGGFGGTQSTAIATHGGVELQTAKYFRR
jgi:hypothetical protein